MKGCLLGARLILPLVPSLGVFAVAVGTLAAQKGQSISEFFLFQGLVFAGMSQIVALGFWQQSWTFSALLGVVIVTLTVNCRMILMGAALQPWLKQEPLWRNALNLFLLTDANWIYGMRYHSQGGRDSGILLGSGLLLWALWMIIGFSGYFAGSFITNPRAIGFDLFMPIFFVIMVAPLWKGHRQTLCWGLAGLIAILVHKFATGYTYIVVGAIVGMLLGAFMPGTFLTDHDNDGLAGHD